MTDYLISEPPLFPSSSCLHLFSIMLLEAKQNDSLWLKFHQNGRHASSRELLLN